MFYLRLAQVFQYTRLAITRSLYTPHQSPVTRMELSKIVSILDSIAPTKCAEGWDNVGLLIEPEQPGLISRVLLTNDLTEEVLKEGVAHGGVGMVISYHPPIFRPFKRLTQSSAKERIILSAVQSNISVYSPHTSLDNMPNGINSWLLSGLGPGETSSLGSKVMKNYLTNDVKLEGVAMNSDMELMLTGPHYSLAKHNHGDVRVLCSDEGLVNLLPKIKVISPSSVTINANTEVHVAPAGGQLLTLVNPEPLSVLITRVKAHLSLSHVRLATPRLNYEKDPVIKSVAVCAGSGGSVLHGVNADLYLTGEMSHHEVLEATSRGTAVVLCDHTNTERGYLQTVYKDMLREALPGVDIIVSQMDSDPLNIV